MLGVFIWVATSKSKAMARQHASVVSLKDGPLGTSTAGAAAAEQQPYRGLPSHDQNCSYMPISMCSSAKWYSLHCLQSLSTHSYHGPCMQVMGAATQAT